jgi:hypothetical protein
MTVSNRRSGNGEQTKPCICSFHVFLTSEYEISFPAIMLIYSVFLVRLSFKFLMAFLCISGKSDGFVPTGISTRLIVMVYRFFDGTFLKNSLVFLAKASWTGYEHQ